MAISYTSKDPSDFGAEMSKTHSVRVKAYRCEITKSSEVNQLLVDVERDYGKKVDIGVANAGESSGPIFRLESQLSYIGVSLWKDAIHNTDGEHTCNTSVTFDIS